MQDDHEDIAKLLRLKRFEQPSADYFENFLEEFKVRQRGQLLREPAWRIAWDRVCAFLGEQMPARIGYGLASTAVLVTAGLASLDILQSRPIEMVSLPDRQPAAETASLDLNTLNSQVQLPGLPSPAHTASISTPRYVMDTRPVSYEPPSSF